MSHRGHRGQVPRKHKSPTQPEGSEDCSPIVKVFQTYQIELDARYDKYERLLKRSRDLTIESKRIIFLLHRSSSDGHNDDILQEAECRLSEALKGIIGDIASELSKRELYQFIRAFSPGLQEFVEAVTFFYYLKSGLVVSIDDVHNPDFLQRSSEDDAAQSDVGLPFSQLLLPSDFILGLADLTGELMRKCINSVAAGDLEEPFRLCAVLRGIHEAFLTGSGTHRELRRKLFTLRGSLQKVENACYAIRIRGSEVSGHMLADFFAAEEGHRESANDDV